MKPRDKGNTVATFKGQTLYNFNLRRKNVVELCKVSIKWGIMEKKMETTIMENHMEKKMENEIDTREHNCQGPHDLQKPNAILVVSPVL